MRFYKTLLSVVLFIAAAGLAGCSGLHVRPDAEHVSLHFVEQQQPFDELVKGCTFVDEVVGSDGRWYTFLFISNPDLTHGALNDMKNNARKLGADTVMVHQRLFFSTSVTFLGQAYRCRPDAEPDNI